MHSIRSIVDAMELKLRFDRDGEGDDTDDDVKDKIERTVRIKNLLNDIDQKFDDSTNQKTQLPAVNDIDTVAKRFKHGESKLSNLEATSGSSTAEANATYGCSQKKSISVATHEWVVQNLLFSFKR